MKFSTLLVLITLAVALPSHAQVTSHWTFEEHQLPIKEGGRVNSIAVNPLHHNEMLVASETGGLFKSTDAGLHWRHIDKLPALFTQSVAYLPSGAVLVSAKSDFRKVNGGGVWRSENGEDDWTHTLVDPFPGHRLDAYEISVHPVTGKIFVGTSRGVFQSINDGVVWGSGFAPPVPLDRTIVSVYSTAGNLYAAGPDGVWVVNGASVTHFNSVGGAREMHAFAWWAQEARMFFVNSEGSLKMHPNSGQDHFAWDGVVLAPPAGACDGVPFVKVIHRAIEGRESLYFYLSNRCGLYTMVVTPPSIQAVFTTPWHLADVDEDEPRDLGIAGEDAVLLGTTAGLHNRPNGLSPFRIVGGGRDGGYNALQINEVKGQLLDGNVRADLYIGTQDNKLWSWRLQNLIQPLRSYGSEGHFIELPRRIAPFVSCKMTFVADERRKKSEEHFDTVEEWEDAPHEDGAPALVRPREYVQQVKGPGFPNGLAFTRDCGLAWEPYASFTQEPRDLPKLARAGDPNDPQSVDVVYQAYKAPNGRNLLMRIERPVFALDAAAPLYPSMTNFGSLGVNPTMYAWYQVYAADPGEPLHLIAADVADGVMRESNDGGETWTEMTALTELLLGTEFNFRAALNGPHAGEIFPIVTAVSFSPQDPRLVLVGTSQAGIFASRDRGETWTKIPESERITYVTSFYWETANAVFVSTYGRGLWKLRNRRIAASIEDFCSSCEVSSSEPFSASALVFDGRVLGVRTDQGRLREVFVTPGSSVVFTGDGDDPQEDIAITFSDGRDTFEPLPKGPDGWIATGVVFTKDDVLTGAAFAKSEMSLLPPASGKQVKGSTESPTKGKPYIRLSASASHGIATAAPQEVFTLSATGFHAGASYEVLVDGVLRKGTPAADANGSFTASITAPAQTGYHSVAVRRAGEETVIDASMMLVRY